MLTDLDAERRLAEAVFQRALHDLQGKGEYMKGRGAQADALSWVREAGPSFRWWCTLAGIDWRLARELLLARAS